MKKQNKSKNKSNRTIKANSCKRKLLWVDGLGALIVGSLVLLMSGWLSKWYQLPQELLIFMGIINMIYGSYSTSLAINSKRPKIRILLLVGANLAWALVCFVLLSKFSKTATIYGYAHLLGEGLYVGGLAYLEWRWRELLLKT